LDELIVGVAKITEIVQNLANEVSARAFRMRALPLFPTLLVALALASAVCALPPARLKYEVLATQERFEPTPSTIARYREARRVFGAVNASPLFVTYLCVSRGGYAECAFIGFDKLEVIVETDGRTASVTLALYNFAAAYREEYRGVFEGLLPGLEASGTFEGYAYSAARATAFTKVFQLDPAGAAGEWLFWLRPEELKLNATVILAHVLPIPYALEQLEFNGTANVVYVNMSQVGGVSYELNGGAVVVDRSRTAVGSSRYSNRYASVFKLKGLDVEQVKRMVPEPFRFVDFGNGTYAIVCSYVYDAYERVKDAKPWKLTKVRRALVHEGEEVSADIEGVIELAGARYIVSSLEPVTLVYDRVTGVLLESSPGTPALPAFLTTFGVLPPPLTNFFGFDTVWSVLREGEAPLLSLKLVESSLHEGEERLGGPGSVDTTAHAAALLAAATLLAAAAGVRRK
jgi:hypothetical protein